MFSEYYAKEGHLLPLNEAEKVLNNLVGTSAASAGAVPGYNNTPYLELGMHYADPAGFERFKQNMQAGMRSPRVPAYKITKA